MAFLDQFQSTVSNQANTSIGQVRNSTFQKLTGLITKAIPSTNKIPGAAGSFLQREAVRQVGDGVNQVLDTLDIRQNTRTATTNPKIYNNGVNAAKGIWTQVNNGETDHNKILGASVEPLTLLKYTDLQVNAKDAGAADVTAPGSETVASAPRYTPYAMDLFRLAPKHKFLFVCEFVFNEGYQYIGQGKTHKNEFALVIKDFERPKIKYDYEDNVNFYNYRTKIVKKIVHDPLTIRFLDDRQNISMKFFHEYLKATHPITSVAPESSDFYEDNGMNWQSIINSASSGVLAENLRTIIKEIKVYHLYDFGAYMNTYHFTNPKVLDMNLDNWTMHESEGSEISAQFGYDAVYIELGIKVTAEEDALIATLSNAGQYPMHPMQVAPSPGALPSTTGNSSDATGNGGAEQKPIKDEISDTKTVIDEHRAEIDRIMKQADIEATKDPLDPTSLLPDDNNPDW